MTRSIIRYSLSMVLAIAGLAMCMQQPAFAQVNTILQDRAVANGNGTPLNTNLQATVALTVNCVSCSGGTAINFEGTQDGTTYKALNATLLSAASSGTSTTTAGTTVWIMSVTGLKYVQARISAYSAGTVTVTGTAVPQGGGGGGGSGGGGGVVSGTIGIDQSTANANEVNPATAANWGLGVEDAAETAGGKLHMMGTVRRDTAASSAGTTGDNATLNTDANGGLWITSTVVDAAEGAAVATNPVPVGCVNRAIGSVVTLDDGDIGYLTCSANNELVISPYSTRANDLAGLITTAMTGTTSTAVTGMGAQGSGIKNYVTGCVVSNSHATVGTDVILQDGSGGSTLFTMPAGAVYGGTAFPFPNPVHTTANTALYAADVTTGASVKLSCVGFKGK